jgi:alpha-mannosidase
MRRFFRLGFFILTGLSAHQGFAQLDRPWRIYLVPFSHTDVGYTAPVADVIQGHLATIDSAVAMVHRTRGNEPGTRFRWTIEIPWVLDAYIGFRTAAQVESLMTSVRNREIEIGAIHFNLQSDLCGNEELVRALAFAQELRTKYGITVRTGMIDDTPGFTWALAQLLAKDHIPYLSVAMNSFLSDFFTTTTLPGLFYWKGQDGTATLVWRSLDSLWAYLEGAATCGVYGTSSDMQTKLTAYLQQQARRGYTGNEIMINCATGDNGPANDVITVNAKAWNDSHPDAKVIIATVSEFFDVVTSQNRVIPTYSGDAPNWWTWLFAPSATGGTVRSREAQIFLPAAETFASMAGQVGAGYPFPRETFRQAYINNLLFEDHNLGANYTGGNEPFWALKMGWVNASADTAQSIINSSVDAIAGTIPTGNAPVVAVFNPLSWTRSIPVTLVPGAGPIAGLGAFDVVDGVSGIARPIQILQNGQIAFVASGVPAVGYRTYRLVARGGSFPGAGALSGLRLQNEFYSATLDPLTGSVVSLLDRAGARELVSPDGQFNQYRFNSTFPPSGLQVTVSDSGPVLQAVTLQGSATGSNSYQTTVRMWGGVKRVEFLNGYDKLAPTSTEGVDFAFHFGLASAELRYEIPFGAVRLYADELSGFRSNHYAVRTWMNVLSGADGYAATLSTAGAPVVANPSGSFNGAVRMLVSYTNADGAYRAGIGPLSMNFAVSTNTGGFQPDSSAKASYDFLSPAPVRVLPANRQGSLDPGQMSWLAVDPDRIVLVTMKGAEDGNGVIVRLFNPLPADVPATLRFPSSVLSADETTPSEEHVQSLSFSGKSIVTLFGAREIKTIRVVLAGTLGVTGNALAGPGFRLNQNYPNPFNGQTRITFELGTRANVSLTVVDILGRKVRELFRGDRSAGTHEETWMGTDAASRPVASGVYFALFEARNASGTFIRQTRPMLYIK